MLGNYRSLTSLSSLDNLCTPRMYELDSNISALQFEIMKLVPARYIVEDALQKGRITRETILIESSSGTFGIALAIVAAHHGLKLRLVTSPIGPALRWRLESLGAKLDVIQAPSGRSGGIQQDRERHLRSLASGSDLYFWTEQHANPLNPESYGHIVSENPLSFQGTDYLICSTGTGGSITGLSRALRHYNPKLKVIGVDHNLSSLFGPTTKKVSRLCAESYYPILGMGADWVPPNLDHTVCDEVHWMPMNEMVRTAHTLHNNFGIFIGPTGAATFRVARWVAQSDPSSRILCVFPDHGARYMDSVYDRSWLSRYEADLAAPLDCSPREVSSSREVHGSWSFLKWNRRDLEAVNGTKSREGCSPVRLARESVQ